MPDRILVINPSSTDSVTRAIDDAMAPLCIPGGPAFDCMTLREGPPGVESQAMPISSLVPPQDFPGQPCAGGPRAQHFGESDRA